MPANKCSNSGCEYFNRPLPYNMEYCPGCSRPLGNVITSAPVQSSPPPVTPNFVSSRPVQREQPEPIPPEETNYQPRSVRPLLKLIHATTKREFRLPGEEGYIGRRSQIHGTVPDIDLVGIPHEGVVSRSHARIFWDWNQNTYMISDTSKNGSYLNGNLLSQKVNYRLSNGDSLQLGQEGLVRFTVVVE